MRAPAPKEDDQIDECLERMDAAFEKITRRRKKVEGSTPLNGFRPEHVKKTRLAFQTFSENPIVSESGDEILLESGPQPPPCPPQLKPTVVLDKKKAKRATG